jgi:hypothetical protein
MRATTFLSALAAAVALTGGAEALPVNMARRVRHGAEATDDTDASLRVGADDAAAAASSPLEQSDTDPRNRALPETVLSAVSVSAGAESVDVTKAAAAERQRNSTLPEDWVPPKQRELGKPHHHTCRPAALGALKARLQCGDTVTIRTASGAEHIDIEEAGKFVLVAAKGCDGERGLFVMHCKLRNDGEDALFGETVFFKSVGSGRLLEDGGIRDSEYDAATAHNRTGVLLSTDVEHPRRHNEFTLFHPDGINRRGEISQGDDIIIRNRFGRYWNEHKNEVWSEIFTVGEPPETGIWSIATEVGPENGCADGTREGFVDEGRHPHVAGCAASWKRPLALCPDGNVGSANGKYACSACSRGFHVCGWKDDVPALKSDAETCPGDIPGVDPLEVSRHVCMEDCKVQPGWFAAAAPSAMGSKMGCHSVGTNASVALGCGHLTLAAGGEGVGRDCSGFKELRGKLCTENRPNGIYSNLMCAAAPISTCGTNPTVGGYGEWRGVMCCRDHTPTTEGNQCTDIGQIEGRTETGDIPTTDAEHAAIAKRKKNALGPADLLLLDTDRLHVIRPEEIDIFDDEEELLK